MSRRLTEILRGRRRWVATAALLALAPKCLLCVLAYAGMGAALGLSGRELCGAATTATAPWKSSLPALTSGLGLIGLLLVAASPARLFSLRAKRSAAPDRSAAR